MRRLIAVLALAATVAAQTQSGTTHTPAHPVTAKAAHPAASGPSKVTGDPVKTDDGLEYWDIKVGTGEVAQAGQTAKVHYTGWLTSGKKFDSPVGKAPFEVTPLGDAPVIRGWNEGIIGMKVGGKRHCAFLPSWPTARMAIPALSRRIQR